MRCLSAHTNDHPPFSGTYGLGQVACVLAISHLSDLRAKVSSIIVTSNHKRGPTVRKNRPKLRFPPVIIACPHQAKPPQEKLKPSTLMHRELGEKEECFLCISNKTTVWLSQKKDHIFLMITRFSVKWHPTLLLPSHTLKTGFYIGKTLSALYRSASQPAPTLRAWPVLDIWGNESP